MPGTVTMLVAPATVNVLFNVDVPATVNVFDSVVEPATAKEPLFVIVTLPEKPAA